MSLFITDFFRQSMWMNYDRKIDPSPTNRFWQVLDWCHERGADEYGNCNMTIAASLLCAIASAYWLLSLMFIWFDCHIYHPSLYTIIFIDIGFVIYPAWIYRRCRAVYFHRHHLGGPYGWGTIEPHERGWYVIY